METCYYHFARRTGICSFSSTTVPRTLVPGMQPLQHAWHQGGVREEADAVRAEATRQIRGLD